MNPATRFSATNNPTFPVDSYKLGATIERLTNLAEFTPNEDAVAGRAFKGEGNYHAPAVIFGGNEWKVGLQTTSLRAPAIKYRWEL